MRCTGFVMTDEDGKVAAVSVGGAQTLAKSLAEADMAKSHVSSYTRKDGTYVAEHEDKRVAKTGGYDHPHVVGKIHSHKVMGDGGRGEKEGSGDPTHSSTTSIGFAGRSYAPTGKKGKSMHDATDLHEFEAEDGHRVWADKGGRVHADSTSEVESLRKQHEAHSAKGGEKPAKAKAPRKSAPKPAKPATPAPAAKDEGPDEHNPKYALQTFPDASVKAAAEGKDDLNRRAKVELAARGLDSDGKWVGFKEAAKHHGVTDKDMNINPDKDQTHGHMQTLHKQVLSRAAKGEIDLNKHARDEHAARGGGKGKLLAKAMLFTSDADFLYALRSKAE